jgi:hypothetical protein
VTHHEHQNYKTLPEPLQKATDGTSGGGDIEQKDNTSEQVSDGVLRAKCAICVPHLPDDPDLADVVKAWPQLPEATRSAIVAIVRAAVADVK